MMMIRRERPPIRLRRRLEVREQRNLITRVWVLETVKKLLEINP
jgi:hypothetical protein